MLVWYRPALVAKVKQPYSIDFDGDVACTVKTGDTVVPSTVIFEGRSSGILQTIRVCRELGVEVPDVSKYVVKDDGEIIERGDIILCRSVAMGTAERIIRASTSGRVSHSRIESGIVDIRAPFSEVSVPAGVHGRVVRVYPDRSFHRRVDLEVTGYAASGFNVTGAKVSGPIHVLKDGTSVYRGIDVDGGCANALVVAGRSLSLALYEALIEAGAKGVIVGGVPQTEYRLLSDFPIPVFVSEGWGIIPINSVLHGVLKEHTDAVGYIDPEEGTLLVCPASGGIDVESGGIYQAGLPGEPMLLTKGQKVQVWDMPFWGYCGTVRDVLENEDLAQVLLGSGQKVLVPSGCLVAIGEE